MAEGRVKIEVRDLSKHFGDLVVLHRLNVDILEGEFLCIVGPTGCGKTTFCNVLAGLQPATGGTVTIDGSEVNLKRHKVSFVFQEPSCLPWRTVWDDVKLGLEIRKAPQDVIREKVGAMLEITGLIRFKDYYPSQLSAGMKQRVAVARAFVTEPDLLLLDEPFGQLDTCARFRIEDELVAVWKKTGRTVIFVTHNLEEAVYLSQRILVCTQKPTGIKAEVIVDLPYPRRIADPEFVAIRRRVTELVKWWE